ncbi:hypothetical protein IAR55_006488 [Kwoniella newhampshirensis]|uniref:non-specific serine/threonine protein kinase n=1 Tax=Kwoniella newhampshirensis TaxID=1651941 RepID=A0AAW0YE73_9TREE
MSGSTQHHITHRMVPLICQALVTSPDEEAVWLEGLCLLTHHKLQSALAVTSSIWLPLLLKALEVSKPTAVINVALQLLCHAADILIPIKSCLIKPLRALGKSNHTTKLKGLVAALEKLDMVVWDSKIQVIGQPKILPEALTQVMTKDDHTSLPAVTQLPVIAQPKRHPLLDEILAHNLPSKSRTVQHAWSQTLLLSPHDNPGVWLHNLFQATLEASKVPEMVITSRSLVDDTLASILSDNSISKDITVALLNLLAFFDKNRQKLQPKVLEAARCSALNHFDGALNQSLPGIVLWYIEQEAEAFPVQANVANLVEANIRVGSADHALGEYNKGYELASNLFEGLDDYERRKTAHWVTAAAWHMEDFESMSDYLAFHPKGTSKSLYKAIVDIHNGQYASAFHHISKAQSLSYDELQAQLGGGPQTALKSLAKTELLVELQEVIQYKSLPELRDSILSTWKTRFKRSHADANSWLKRLEVWTLACPPTTFQLQNCFLNTAKLCESTGMHEAAKSIIARITPKIQPPGCKVEYTKLRFEQIVSRRYYRLAEWHAVLQGDNWLDDPNSLVLAYTSLAAKLDTEWQDAIAVSGYIVPSLRGLFQAARTRESPEHIIKALLRLVTLWFRFGESQAVLVEVENQLRLTAVEPWLSAIPQLIARLGTPHKALQLTLLNLLRDISSHYPHAVIWPLLTAAQTQQTDHQGAARVVMDFICTMPDGTRLVDQAELVGGELIRISISWMERWRNLIDKALPRQELMQADWEGLPALWEHDMKKLMVPETHNEEQFTHQFGGQLQQVYKLLIRYQSTRQHNLIYTVYTDLLQLYGDIDARLNQWRLPGSRLYIGATAPRLLSIRDCILTVPGNEDLRGDERIMQLFKLINTLLNHHSEAFNRNLHLLPYVVVPLSPSAGLVSWVPNTRQLQAIIQSNRGKNKQNSLTDKEQASLLGYNPLTFNPRTEKPRFDPSAEMDRYDKLPVEVKVERLKAALSHSKQSDLKDVLWQRSPSADIWIKRRTNFARTIGVGSFVGYIIGLGDRHGSNILIDQLTWGALHIDFGDLFNVAQERAYAPERVPFRLTRMMTNAFELASRGGVETPGSRGTFKQASLIVVDVLRDSHSSLLAMLEAFLYDPLLSWTAGAAESSKAVVQTSPNQEQDPVSKQHMTGVNDSHATIQSASQIGIIQHHIQGRSSQSRSSIIDTYLESDSYGARSSGAGMTNSKALQVLSQIERKLVGYHNDSAQPLTVNQQVQELIEEATDLRNLSQGYVLGWIPHW